MIDIHIQKKLGDTSNPIQLAVNININKGEFITLYGPSGSGKTSTLRMLAGLLKVDQGHIVVNDNVWIDTNQKICLQPQDRNIGYVFQEYALFPNMTVRQNLKYALEKKQDPDIIDELIRIVGLEKLQDRKPATLSGGQQQRVALARALVRKPKILLLDEPLSALDVEMRTSLQDYILQLHKQYNLTTIMVSHDIAEIVKMSDQMFCIDQGKITKSGTPIALFTNNQVSGKFQFIGEILEIVLEDVVYIVTLLVASTVVKVIAQEDEISGLSIGDRVVVASKAFNPVIKKIE